MALRAGDPGIRPHHRSRAMSRYSAELLEQAGNLARREPRRPKQASLRRSISASYYSLFHFLIEEATRLTVGSGHNRKALRE